MSDDRLTQIKKKYDHLSTMDERGFVQAEKQMISEAQWLLSEVEKLRDKLGCEICDWEFQSLEPPTPTVLCPECHGIYMVRYPDENLKLRAENKRLREALKTVQDEPFPGLPYSVRKRIERIQWCVRKALEADQT